MLPYLNAYIYDTCMNQPCIGKEPEGRNVGSCRAQELGTTLGTVLQLSHKIQQRQWTVFNALRKPERAVVNIQPLDFERRSGYLTMGENMWPLPAPAPSAHLVGRARARRDHE